MRARCLCILALGVVAGFDGARAQNRADLEPVGLQMRRFNGVCTAEGPQVGEQTCVTVTVRNNGPDPYNGYDHQSHGSSPLTVTVDIEEPTKPGLEPLPASFTLVDSSYVGNIPVGGTVLVDFASHSFVPSRVGVDNAEVTVAAGIGNVDPVEGNNRLVTVFGVGTTAVPASNPIGLVALAAGLCAGGLWSLRRHRSRAIQ